MSTATTPSMTRNTTSGGYRRRARRRAKWRPSMVGFSLSRGSVELAQQHGTDEEGRQGKEDVDTEEPPTKRPVVGAAVEEDHVGAQHCQDRQPTQSVEVGLRRRVDGADRRACHLPAR